jgi:rifampin ADP-ribosylating transferase
MDADSAAQRVELATGVRLSYVWIGPISATPVLLLHAWGESRRSFDRLLQLLPTTMQVVALDQRGHGDADKPPVGYSLPEFAQDIEAFMDAVGISSAVLLGSSSGGYVAQQVAITLPHRVAGLVLVGSPRSLRGRPSFAEDVDKLSDPVDAEWVRESLLWFPRFHRVPDWCIDDRICDGVQIPAHVWRKTLNGLCTARPPTEIETITSPTVIVWGSRDELLTREEEQELAAAIPGSRLIVYEETGHLVLWEQPERLAGELTNLIEKLSPQPA